MSPLGAKLASVLMTPPLSSSHDLHTLTGVGLDLCNSAIWPAASGRGQNFDSMPPLWVAEYIEVDGPPDIWTSFASTVLVVLV